MSKQLKHLPSRERESTQSGNMSSGTSTTLQQRKRLMKKDKEMRKGSGTKLSIQTIEPDMQQAKTLFKPDSTVKQLPTEYYVSISVDGSRHMDQPNHLSNEQVNNTCLERKLRPISGLRHYVKPNTNVVDDTDFIERVSRLSTIKWLDLSSNNLKSYPKQLCNLTLLEKLNLTDNKLSEKTIPIEIENYESLLEMVLDSNCLTDLPKALPHFKKMVHLSAQNNSIGNLKLLEGLRKLRYLNMNGNNISTIDEALYDLDKLEMLYLSHNRLNLLQPKFLRANLNNLKQLDVSFNCVTFIPAEIFLLPHLDSLNLSNNRITKLPSLPVTFNRSLPINSVDLSSNGLQKFYEYLLTVAVHTDLSANRIRCLPSIAIRNLTVAQSNRKSLKLDGNPLEYPPLDVCTSGLRILKLFFEEAALTMPLKHGFKISMIGDDGSGKTSLAYAIEDYNAQTNLMEQLIGLVEAPKGTNSALEVPQEIEEKFIEVHEFSFKCNKEEKYWKNESLPSNDTKTNDKNLKMQQSMPVSIFDINGSPSQFGHLNYTFIDKTSLIILCVDVTTFDKQLNSDIETAEKNLKYWLDLIFFKMSRTCSMYVLPVCTKCDSFLKMHKKLQDTWNLQQKELEQSKIDPIQLLLNPEEHDQSRDNLAKKKAEIANRLKSVSKSILTTINNHFKARLNYVKTELDKIEGQTKISASESDRLKRFANVYNYSKPSVHTECITTSSASLEGIEHLNNTIRDIACNNDKYFPNVNKRIPSLWNEVENYMFSWLNHIKKKSNANYDTMSIATYSLPSLSVLCMDYDEYKARILEKYGMDDMLAQITNFFTSEGKLLWIQDSKQTKAKVFFNLNMLFEFIYTLYKADFESNFTNNLSKIIRTKLSLQSQNNMNYIQRLKNDLLTTGCAHIELLKFIWSPVMLSTSSELLTEIVLLMVIFFHIGYPKVSKNQMKMILANVPYFVKTDFSKDKIQKSDSIKGLFGKINESDDSVDDDSDASVILFPDKIGRRVSTTVKPEDVKLITDKLNIDLIKKPMPKTKPTFDKIMIPFYMPKIENLSKMDDIRFQLMQSATELTECAYANSHNSNTNSAKPLIPVLGMKYTFLWSLVTGVFERFSVNCILNTDLYYKTHWKDAIYAHNEQNSIAVLMYIDGQSGNQEVVFEFFLIDFLMYAKANGDQPEPSTLMLDMESLWNFVFEILALFEESISIFPSMIYDKTSQCPECKKFSFLAEWSTPKECQNLKTKACKECAQNIDTIYLVKPSSGKNLGLQLKRMRRRLEDLVEMGESSQTFNEASQMSRVRSAGSKESLAGRNKNIIKQTIQEEEGDEERVKSGSNKSRSPERVHSASKKDQSPEKAEIHNTLSKYELLVKKINPNKRKSVADLKLEMALSTTTVNK